jgi:hypothetical protein
MHPYFYYTYFMYSDRILAQVAWIKATKEKDSLGKAFKHKLFGTPAGTFRETVLGWTGGVERSAGRARRCRRVGRKCLTFSDCKIARFVAIDNLGN